MRLLLVLAAAIALALVAFLFLWAGPGSAPPEPAPSATVPERSDVRAPPPAVELQDGGGRTSAGSESFAARVPSADAAVERGTIAIVLLGGDARARSAVMIECRDALARPLALASGSNATWKARDVVPGEYVVAVHASACVPVLERIVVRPVAEEQRFEVRLERAPRVRVRWQTDDGRPFLDALSAPGVLRSAVVVRVAVDSVARKAGEPAANGRSTVGIPVEPAREGFAPQPPWDGAPADAVCEIDVVAALPATIWGAVDGLILDAATVVAGTSEVVLRARPGALGAVGATVRFCVVDAATGERVADAQYDVDEQSGVGREVLHLRDESCLVDTRLTPGRWSLLWHAPGHAQMRREIALAPADDVDLGELRLEPAAELTARVLRADGAFEPGVTVVLHAIDGPGWHVLGESTTDAKGLATFGSLGSEELVAVIADRRYTALPVRVRPNATAGPARVELRLQPGVEVALDCGPHSAHECLVVRDASGAPVANVFVPLAGVVPLRLLPGEYVGELQGASSARAFTVTDESVVYELR